MAKMGEQIDASERTAELMRKLIIVQLGLAGVEQQQIRKIVGGAMAEINDLVKLIRPKKAGGA